MRLPNVAAAVINPAKVRDYLLDLSHPVGSAKARFFLQFGFSRERWQLLAAALLEHALTNDVSKVEVADLGTRYIIDGPLSSPAGTALNLRCVWYIDVRTTTPRLITAYPLPKR